MQSNFPVPRPVKAKESDIRKFYVKKCQSKTFVAFHKDYFQLQINMVKNGENSLYILTATVFSAKVQATSGKETQNMFERFTNRFNTCGSRANANESASASSSCASYNKDNSTLLLSLDTVFAVSIFAVLNLIIIRLLSVIIILCDSISIRPAWQTAQ